MRFQSPVPLSDIAALIGARLAGNASALARGINEIHRVEKDDLAFVDHPKYYEKVIQSAASFIIINKEVPFPEGKALLITDDPFDAYLRIVERYRPFIPATSMISGKSSIGKDTILMPNVFIGDHVEIGDRCVIHPGVVIHPYSVIGHDVVIQSGTVIGSDAFYYNRKTNRDIQYRRMNSCGRVVIHDHVEIGAGCTIDRGVTSDTIIGAGTKMDNMVHIGHDTQVGRNCLFAAQVGIAGATIIEDNVTLWGQVGVNKTLTIGKDATVYAQSGVKDSIAGGRVYFGSPVEEAREKMKEYVWIRRIPELWEKIMGKNS